MEGGSWREEIDGKRARGKENWREGLERREGSRWNEGTGVMRGIWGKREGAIGKVLNRE